MPKYLRKLEKATWWDRTEELIEAEISADAFRNVSSEKGEISVFRVESEEDVRLTIAALSYRRNVIRDLDYCLFETEVIEQSEVLIRQSDGTTSCARVDKELHHDLHSLTIQSLPKFVAKAIMLGEIESCSKAQVEAAIRDYLERGSLDLKHFHQDLRPKFEK